MFVAWIVGLILFHENPISDINKTYLISYNINKIYFEPLEST